MRNFISQKSKITMMALVTSSFVSLPALALTLEDLPTACLPDRAKKDQMEACHCPPPEMCGAGYVMPNFLYSICCEDDEPPVIPPGGLCTQNGCTTGWHKVMVRPDNSPIPMPEYYCDTQPTCSQIFDHIPLTIRNNILEYQYNYPERLAVNKLMTVVNPDGSTTATQGWICDASSLNGGNNAYGVINPQFWVIPSLVSALGEENVCVIPAFVDGNCFNRIGVNYSDIGDCVPTEDCLPSETKVLLDDGKEVLISEIKVGDKLKTQTSTNTVEEVMIYKTGTRQLYSINDGKFTITEGHPLLTQSGWVTAGNARAAVNAEEKNWVGRALKVGDQIIGKDNAIRVTKIAPLDMPSVETYNLKLSGDNTFIANGVVVQGFTSIDVKYEKETEGKK